LLYVPLRTLRLQILQARHDFPSAGHFGYNKTFELIFRDYWWLQMWKLLKDYIKSCNICSCAKCTCHPPHGLLHPLPIPKRPWTSLSMDFIINLLISHDFDSILLIVDHFTKMSQIYLVKNQLLVKEWQNYL